MKVIICNEIRENDPQYFKLGWRIPFEQLSKLGWTSVDQSKISGKISNYFIEVFGALPKVLFFWNTNTLIKKNIKEILNNNWIKCIYMDDLHQTSSKVIEFRKMIIENFDFIFSTYAYTFDKFYNIPGKEKLIWFPHSINDNFKTEFNPKPLQRILLTGCIEKSTYPFRFFVSGLSSKYPIDILPSLSYKKQNHQYIGHQYIKYMSRYLASITCCSNEKTPYIVSKFFEIPASGALLLAYDEHVKEPLKELGFIDGENYLSANRDNIIEKILFITNPNNKLIVDNIRYNGYQMVWQKHTLFHRAQLIDGTITKKYRF